VKRRTLEQEREEWRERGRRDARRGMTPRDVKTLQAVGGELAARAYAEGYAEVTPRARRVRDG
jgi:hypothetical protein